MEFINSVIRIFAKWPAVVAMLSAIIFFWREYRHHAPKFWSELTSTTITVFLAWAVSGILKLIVHAPRPFVEKGIENQFMVQSHTSFPSGHATIFFALATIIFMYSKRTGIMLYCFAIVIATARVVAGIHYPIDVVAGALIGIGIALILHRSISPHVSTIFLRKKQ